MDLNARVDVKDGKIDGWTDGWKTRCLYRTLLKKVGQKFIAFFPCLDWQLQTTRTFYQHIYSVSLHFSTISSLTYIENNLFLK